MGLRFRKTISIMNGVKMNVSTSGVSFTVGKSGRSINIGSKGTYLNLGLAGTGISYRQKLTKGYGSIIDLFKKKDSKEEKAVDVKAEDVKKTSFLKKNDDSVKSQYEEYLKDYDAYINIHKYAEDVHAISYFMETITDDELLKKVINGDEDTVEEIIAQYTAKVELPYKIDVNFELEDDILYVDLDLPEIEDIEIENYELKDNEMVTSKKSKAKLQEEYCHIVQSLTIYLAALYFNSSSYISSVVISGYTQRRNKDGDLANDYIISVKYTREIFENTKLAQVEDSYKFITKFENRINITATYIMKTITPYETKTVEVKESFDYDELTEGFKRLGYKANDIANIIPKLKEMNLTSEDACFKEGLKLLKENK